MSHVAKPYTVIVGRPDNDFANIYVGQVKAANPAEAEDKAIDEVIRADRADAKLDGEDPPEECAYSILVVFEGHPAVAKFGWQS